MFATADETTTQEQANVELVTRYMRIAYDPKRASAEAVKHLCAPDNQFIAPTTFPGIHTLEEYAEEHGKLMRQVNDLRLIDFDVLFAQSDRVCRRYTAEGSHSGDPHGNVAPSGRRARWTACGIFRVRDGKLAEFIKEWNKLSMWEQFGWPLEECLTSRKSGK